MNEFFDNYFNIRKMIESKREYKETMARVKKLPEDYEYVFKKIQSHMWNFGSGAGYDMMAIHNDLVDLFEESAANGKDVLEVTGDDVAAFCEELLRNASTYAQDWRTKLNREIHDKLRR